MSAATIAPPDAPDVATESRVMQLIEAYLGHEWLNNAPMLSLDTRLAQLNFDPLDQFAAQRQLELAFSIPYPPSLPLPDTIGGIVAFVERGLARQHRLAIARQFFAERWRELAGSSTFSEHALLAEVLGRNARSPLDIGCGDNLFASRVRNLVGIDVVNPCADQVLDFFDYRNFHAHDLILALGSINFGSEEDILDDLTHARALMSADGVMYMRANPGVQWPQCPELPIFAWTSEKVHALGARAGLAVEQPITIVNGANGPRMMFSYRAVAKRFA